MDNKELDVLEKPRKRKKKKSTRRSRRKRAIIMFSIEAVLLLFVVGGIWGYFYLQDRFKNIQDSSFNEDEVNTNQGVSENLKGYTNIALFGIDSRGSEFDEATHSDTIMIASINNETGQVKLVSIYRDTLLQMTDTDGEVAYRKANAAYNNGGATEAINMLNTNLDLDIKDYAIVNFSGLATIIDALGGIDINVSYDEVYDYYGINGYLTETREITGIECPDVTDYGLVHLNGLQATAYCRLRYLTFTAEDGTKYHDDYGRTQRQRYVLSKVAEKAKKASVSQLTDILNAVLPANESADKMFETSLSFDEIKSMLARALKYELADTSGFPTYVESGEYPAFESQKSVVVPKGLEYNVKLLHEFLFDDTDYTPTSTVTEISNYLTKKTGVQPETETVEESDTSTEE